MRPLALFVAMAACDVPPENGDPAVDGSSGEVAVGSSESPTTGGDEDSSGGEAPLDDDGESSGDDGAGDGSTSDGDTGEAPAACVDYDDPANFAESAEFEADVLPVFRRSCTQPGCHNSQEPAPAAGLRLGLPGEAPMTPAQVDGVHSAIVGVPALKAEMDLIASYDPAGSFLLAKAEYGNPTECEAVDCKPAGCGVAMPVGFPPLPTHELSALRTWIRDGAPR